MDITNTQNWVKAAAAIVIGVGLLLAAAAWPPLALPVALLADIIVWPLDGVQTLASPETRVFSAISGGVMVGWGVTLWKVAEHVLPVDPAVARSIVLTGIYSWFAVDSIGSIAAGAPLNAVLNIGFVVLFVWALRSPRRIAA